MDLYAELILEHAKQPHGAGLREPFAGQSHQVNPTCGDEVTLRIAVQGSGSSTVVRDVSYDIQGCAISQASTSVLHDLVAGQPLSQVHAVADAMHAMVTGRGEVVGDEAVLGDGVALAGVARYPARVTCALLGWMALREALAQATVSLDARTPHVSPDNQPPGDRLPEEQAPP
ncbi:MAG: Fe-S cluster assembly sulfur transfer protein SufU [Angustibacter sp.]